MAENAVTVNVRSDDDRLHDAVRFLQRTEAYYSLLSDIQNRGITQVEIAPESLVNHNWEFAPDYTGIENGVAIVFVDTERSFPSGNMRGYLSVEEIIAHELAHHALGHTASQEIDGFFGSVRRAALEAATMIHVNRTLRKELNLPQRLSFEANPWEIIDRPTYLHENPRYERYLQPNLPRNQRPDPKTGPGAPRGGDPLNPIDNPNFAPPQSARDLEGYRFGDLTIDQFSPRAVEVLDAIQRNAGVADLQVISRTPGLISTSAVGELGPERDMNGETVQISVADLPTEQRLAVLDAAIRAGVTDIDADDGTLTLEVRPETGQGEREPGPRRAVADQDSWVYESQNYQNFVAGATIFPENPAPRPAFEANERVSRAFDDARRATVLPSESAAGASPSAQSSMTANARVDQAFRDVGRASGPSARSPDQFQYRTADARRAAAPPTSRLSRSVSLTNPFAFTRPVESIRPAASFPPAPSRTPSRSTPANQYRQRALQMTGRVRPATHNPMRRSSPQRRLRPGT